MRLKGEELLVSSLSERLSRYLFSCGVRRSVTIEELEDALLEETILSLIHI